MSKEKYYKLSTYEDYTRQETNDEYTNLFTLSIELSNDEEFNKFIKFIRDFFKNNKDYKMYSDEFDCDSNIYEMSGTFSIAKLDEDSFKATIKKCINSFWNLNNNLNNIDIKLKKYNEISKIYDLLNEPLMFDKYLFNHDGLYNVEDDIYIHVNEYENNLNIVPMKTLEGLLNYNKSTLLNCICNRIKNKDIDYLISLFNIVKK